MFVCVEKGGGGVWTSHDICGCLTAGTCTCYSYCIACWEVGGCPELGLCTQGGF